MHPDLRPVTHWYTPKGSLEVRMRAGVLSFFDRKLNIITEFFRWKSLPVASYHQVQIKEQTKENENELD